MVRSWSSLRPMPSPAWHCPNGATHTSPGCNPGYRIGLWKRSEGTPHKHAATFCHAVFRPWPRTRDHLPTDLITVASGDACGIGRLLPATTAFRTVPKAWSARPLRPKMPPQRLAHASVYRCCPEPPLPVRSSDSRRRRPSESLSALRHHPQTHVWQPPRRERAGCRTHCRAPTDSESIRRDRPHDRGAAASKECNRKHAVRHPLTHVLGQHQLCGIDLILADTVMHDASGGCLSRCKVNALPLQSPMDM